MCIRDSLNITPDSFSDGGRYCDPDAAAARAEQMQEEGADLIDVGGESTRPGYTQIPAKEEIRRIVPVIRKLKSRLDLPVSVDTYKAEVAEAALLAGADMINDIRGLKYDPEMASLIARHGAACCLMHSRDVPEYGNLIRDMKKDLAESLRLAVSSGIGKDRILLDPGIGFGKTYEMNLEVLKNLGEFHELGVPLLLGVSRKSVIGLTLLIIRIYLTILGNMVIRATNAI